MDIKNSAISPIKDLDTGVETISRWRVDDETHLPDKLPPAPHYLPTHRPLHSVLHRPTLNERLLDLLQPATIDPALMNPADLHKASIDARTLIAQHMDHASGAARETLRQALHLIDSDKLLNEEVNASLAALYRG